MSQYLTRRSLLAGSAFAPLSAARDLRTSNAEGAPLTLIDPTPTEKMQRVLKAWEIADELNYAELGASAAEIAEAERILGFALPESMRTLYAGHDGGEYIGGNIAIEPIRPRLQGHQGLTFASNQLREWDWEIPPEMLVFGGDGGDSVYGIWRATGDAREPIVVECLEAADLMIVGDDLASFLTGRTAFYLLLYASDSFNLMPALDLLEVPEHLRELDIAKQDDDLYDGLARWANPGLPPPSPDPYGGAMSAEQIREFVATRDR